MKNFCVSLAVAIMLMLPSTAISQQAGSLTKLYDDFSGKWLDPEKWLPWHINCWGALECVREIRSNKLHLAVRNVGAADSDQFITWSESQVYFPEPNAVTSIRADITVESFGGIGCSTNETDRTHTQVMIGGTFFNVGTGDPTGDIVAWLIVWVDTFDPQTMNVGGWWGYQDQGFWTEIASYPMRRPLTGTIKWDKANRQFIASVMAKGEPEPRAEVMMPYFDWMSDTEPPVNPWKNLCAQQHTLNCTSAKTTGQVEASFDNVIINR